MRPVHMMRSFNLYLTTASLLALLSAPLTLAQNYAVSKLHDANGNKQPHLVKHVLKEVEKQRRPKRCHTEGMGKPTSVNGPHHKHGHGHSTGRFTSSSTHHDDSYKKQKHKPHKGPRRPTGSIPDLTKGSTTPRSSGDHKPGALDPQGKRPVGSTTPIPGKSGDPPKKKDPSTDSPKGKTSPPATPPTKTGKVITTYKGAMRGNATFYAVDDDGRGNCLLPRRTDRMFAAINNDGWAGSAQCGMCVRVSTLDGKRTTTVMITNREPVDDNGALDLSEAAFTALADRSVGRLLVNWIAVNCVEAGLATGKPSVVWKVGSTPYWFAVQVRESALPLSQVSIRISSTDGASSWTKLPRTDYNFWLAEHGLVDNKQGKSKGPFDLSVEYQDGSTIELKNIALNSEVLHQP